jgi:hypothetical protein
VAVADGVNRGVVASRVIHGAIALVFLLCIVEVWRAALTGDAGPLTVVALVLLALEGVLFLAAGGHCPLGPLWRRLGDDTPFFDLLLGRRLGRLAVPVLGGVSLAGAAILGLRLL